MKFSSPVHIYLRMNCNNLDAPLKQCFSKSGSGPDMDRRPSFNGLTVGREVVVSRRAGLPAVSDLFL